MRILIAAVGRLKADAERGLFQRYLDRAAAAGRALALHPDLREIPESRAARPEERKRNEAAALAAQLPPGAVLVALDERGRTMASDAFAARLAQWRDDGVADLAVVIGGADGLAAELRDRAALTLALGPMTWPHQLARILLAEQLYRAMTILSGHPYHRV